MKASHGDESCLRVALDGSHAAPPKQSSPTGSYPLCRWWVSTPPPSTASPFSVAPSPSSRETSHARPSLAATVGGSPRSPAPPANLPLSPPPHFFWLWQPVFQAALMQRARFVRVAPCRDHRAMTTRQEGGRGGTVKTICAAPPSSPSVLPRRAFPPSLSLLRKDVAVGFRSRRSGGRPLGGPGGPRVGPPTPPRGGLRPLLGYICFDPQSVRPWVVGGGFFLMRTGWLVSF